MLSRRIVAVRPLSRLARTSAPRTSAVLQTRYASSTAEEDPEITDPGQNGGYINPPRIKRQFRDPHGDWWYKQQRRNYGEPVHEDDDILGMFTPEEYTWVKPGFGLVMIGTFIAAVGGLCTVVYQFYPDIPAVPKSYEGGLVEELGGNGALRAKQEDDETFQRSASSGYR